MTVSLVRCPFGEEVPNFAGVPVTVRKVRPRSDDMVVVLSVNVFPSEMEQVVLDSKELSPTYFIVLDTTVSGPTSPIVASRQPMLMSAYQQRRIRVGRPSSQGKRGPPFVPPLGPESAKHPARAQNGRS